MDSASPVTIHQILCRGAVSFKLKWMEDGTEHEASFPSEAEAVMEMDAIEERLRLEAMSERGVTVNPFGMHTPFISSKDVHFAALKLQPRGLKFRESIEDYVAAVNAVKGMGTSLATTVASVVELNRALKPYGVSLQQAVFEWMELKKHIGDRPLYEALREYLKMEASIDRAEPDEAAGGSTNIG